ncbi:terminase [Sesbania bispinosa]|nr:terminase [Sesbania bispinosa]
MPPSLAEVVTEVEKLVKNDPVSSSFSNCSIYCDDYHKWDTWCIKDGEFFLHDANRADIFGEW